MEKKIFGLFVILAVLGGVGLFTWALTNNEVTIGYNKGYMPDQPIPFSHERHAGQYQIDCRYCHTGAETTRHASVPSLNICMNCHTTIDVNGSEHIARLREAYEKGEPIQWKKVHLLPDHVKFNHSPHVLAGKQCQECHGPVETMSTVYQFESLSMGWCVKCHKPHEDQALTNCSTCHY